MNFEFYESLEKNEDFLITKPEKGNGVVILYQKRYNAIEDNTIQEIISDTFKFN